MDLAYTHIDLIELCPRSVKPSQILCLTLIHSGVAGLRAKMLSDLTLSGYDNLTSFGLCS